MAIDLIFCAKGNRRMAQIAIDAGFCYGARFPGTVYHPVFFADQDYKKPNRKAYMQCLDQHRPIMATVLDWQQDDQLPEVLDWATEAAQYVSRVVIVPKVMGGIRQIPVLIGGCRVVLGYSVPTSYGGTCLPLWEFAGRAVHLLGGSPQQQMEIWRYLSNIADVISVDGNMALKMATRHCAYWTKRGWLTSVMEFGYEIGNDGPYRAFEQSCAAIYQAWDKLARVTRVSNALVEV